MGPGWPIPQKGVQKCHIWGSPWTGGPETPILAILGHFGSFWGLGVINGSLKVWVMAPQTPRCRNGQNHQNHEIAPKSHSSDIPDTPDFMVLDPFWDPHFGGFGHPPIETLGFWGIPGFGGPKRGPFWVDFGPFLGPFWAPLFGPLHRRFRRIWGPESVHFWVHFGSILVSFWTP